MFSKENKELLLDPDAKLAQMGTKREGDIASVAVRITPQGVEFQRYDLMNNFFHTKTGIIRYNGRRRNFRVVEETAKT